jgi:hypothetical protein
MLIKQLKELKFWLVQINSLLMKERDFYYQNAFWSFMGTDIGMLI